MEFLADLVSQESVQGLRGTLQLQPSDGGTPWWIDLDTGATLQDELVKSDTVIRATYSDLLLWLTNRGRVDALETSGNVGVIEDWQQLRR